MNESLSNLLIAAAASQLIVAVLNLNLVRMLRWESDVAQMPLLLREVFQVHSWFISATLIIFAVITFRFAPDMATGTNEPLRWLAGGIGTFWALRFVLQVTYYDRSHWIGKSGPSLIHAILLVLYGGLATVYLWTAA